MVTVRGLGRGAGAARRPARHRALRRGDGRQPRRDAGAAVDDLAIRSGSRHAIVIAAAPQALGAEHRVQRGRAPGDHHRPGFPRRRLLRARRGAAARPAARAHDRPHHLSVRRRDDGEVRPRRCARARSTSTSTSTSRSSRTCATRATSSPSTSTRTPTCSSPGRSTTSIRRTHTAATSPRALAPAQGALPGGVVHLRLALLARSARARSSRRCSTTAATSPTPRSTRRTGTTRSCSTTRATTRWCAPTSTTSRARWAPSRRRSTRCAAARRATHASQRSPLTCASAAA